MIIIMVLTEGKETYGEKEVIIILDRHPDLLHSVSKIFGSENQIRLLLSSLEGEV